MSLVLAMRTSVHVHVGVPVVMYLYFILNTLCCDIFPKIVLLALLGYFVMRVRGVKSLPKFCKDGST